MRAERLVLLHGFTQGGGIWLPVIERLTIRCALDAPDLPGHGASSLIATSLPETADALVTEFGSAAWVGYSMGGRLALHVALQHPHHVSHLVLCSTTAGLRDADERAQRRANDEKLASHIREIGTVKFLDEWLAQPLFATLRADRPDVALDRDVREANLPEGLASSLEFAGTGAQASLWEQLPSLTMPVLIVTGELDTKFTAIGAEMAAAIGDNAHHIVMAGCGHSLPFEHPDSFARIVDEFVG